MLIYFLTVVLPGLIFLAVAAWYDYTHVPTVPMGNIFDLLKVEDD